MGKGKAKNSLGMQWFTTGVSTTLVLILLGTVAFFVLFAQRLSESVKENLTVTVLLREEATDADIARLRSGLQKASYVHALDYVSKERALEEQVKAMGSDPSEFLGFNPFTASFELRMKASYANSDSLSVITAGLKKMPAVEDVLYQKDLVDTVNDNLRRASYVLLGIAVLLALVSFALINNTVRLSIYSGRFVIRTMQLVGASRAFIRRPFMARSFRLGFLSGLPAKLAAGALLALAAYGGEAKLMRLTLLFFAVSCAMAGCVLGLGLLAGGGMPMAGGVFYTDVDARVLLISAGAAYLVLSVVFRASARHGVQGELVEVRVRILGRTAALTALCDTGNSLRDPATGAPVLVAGLGRLDGALPREVRALLTEETLAHPASVLEQVARAAPALRPRLVPYRAVGVSGGLLLAIRSDWTEAAGERYDGLTVALAPTELGPGHSALWGGGRKRRGSHEELERAPAPSAGPCGPAAAAGGGLLHRRQRHPAPAADKGAGGGAFGAPGGRGRPERAHRA